MRLMLYGGCHALVLSNYLEFMFPAEMRVKLLINFDLIRRNEPFPYEELDTLDAVIFSPIERDGPYNTSNLTAECRLRGVKALCFPWLEWHGYTPGATKGEFKSRFQWYLPEVCQRASEFNGNLDQFVDDVIATFPADHLVAQTIEGSTDRLMSSERRHDTFFSLSGFLAEHFAAGRQFLIPDHPSRTIYVAILERLLRELNVSSATIAERLQLIPEEEPQRQWRMPIFPRTVEQLKLSFSDDHWVDEDVVPNREIDLKAYLSLYYFGNTVIMRPLAGAALNLRTGEGKYRRIEVPPNTRVVAAQTGSGAQHDTYRLITDLSNEITTLPCYQQFDIDRHQWQSSWL